VILVVGSRASGKRAYVQEALGFSMEQMADATLNERPVVYNLQEMIRGRELTADALIPELLRKRVVICDEVGSGVIPLARGEREWREAVGRVCVLLAKDAEQVVRLVCGIPNVIKG
jgi:adenosyl cobinamide kinase/adenosyl cobinamide phosphate guanylyltransferase